MSISQAFTLCFDREELLGSVLDDRDLWLLQVEIDVYTLLKKVSGRHVHSLYRDLWLLQVEIDVYTLLKKVSGRHVHSLYRDLWLLQVEIDVYTLLKRVIDGERWTVCTGTCGYFGWR